MKSFNIDAAMNQILQSDNFKDMYKPLSKKASKDNTLYVLAELSQELHKRGYLESSKFLKEALLSIEEENPDLEIKQINEMLGNKDK